MKLVEQFPHIKDLEEGYEYSYCAMLYALILSGNSDTHIPLQVFEFLQLNDQPAKLLIDSSLDGIDKFNNLCCAASRRCVNSLICNVDSTATEFALEFLPLMLDESRLSPDLYEACNPQTRFAGDKRNLQPSIRRAYISMQSYRRRYEEAQLVAAE